MRRTHTNPNTQFPRTTNEAGHFHIFVMLIVVVAAIAATGWYVYQQNHKPSKVTDSATRAKLAQTSAELKQIDLGTVKQTVDTVNNVQGSFDYKKSNEQ